MSEFARQTTTIIGVLIFLGAVWAALWANLTRPKIERRAIDVASNVVLQGEARDRPLPQAADSDLGLVETGQWRFRVSLGDFAQHVDMAGDNYVRATPSNVSSVRQKQAADSNS
jgi:hypothetical protein